MTNILPEIYDHEILQIEGVLKRLNERAEQAVDYDAFDREIKERFAEIGFVAKTQWWHTSEEGVKSPDITITGRTHHVEFDPDRQVHEAVNNVLELPGQGGWIDSQKAMGDLERNHKHKH